MSHPWSEGRGGEVICNGMMGEVSVRLAYFRFISAIVPTSSKFQRTYYAVPCFVCFFRVCSPIFAPNFSILRKLLHDYINPVLLQKFCFLMQNYLVYLPKENTVDLDVQQLKNFEMIKGSFLSFLRRMNLHIDL